MTPFLMAPVLLPLVTPASVTVTATPPNPKLPRFSRRLALLGALCVAWIVGAPGQARAAQPDGARVAGYEFSVAACTPGQEWCSEIFALPELRPLEACKALAPVFDGPRAHKRVLGGVSPEHLVLRWACTPRFQLPEA